MQLNTTEELIEDIRQGRMVIVADEFPSNKGSALVAMTV